MNSEEMNDILDMLISEGIVEVATSAHGPVYKLTSMGEKLGVSIENLSIGDTLLS
jgi:predicted transcriptional regulator